MTQNQQKNNTKSTKNDTISTKQITQKQQTNNTQSTNK